jgi:hypothetical protein
MKGFIVFLLGIVSLLYILNIGIGFIELIPDNIPIIGNLDEAGAAMLLVNCLKYFGIDLTNLFTKDFDKHNIIEV